MNAGSVAAVTILGLLSGVWGWSTAAMACTPMPGSPVAFARLGPIKTWGGPDAGDPELAPRNLPFGVAYPVLADASTRVGLCVDDETLWLARSHVAVVPEARWAQTQNDDRPDRPENHFWESQVELGRFLAHDARGGGSSTSPPSYRELALVRKPGSARFPVFNTDFIEQELGDKQVEIAQVLVPFSARVIDAYRFTRDRGLASIFLIVDLSGSTAGLIAPWMETFATRLRGAAPELGQVALLTFGGDGDLRGPTLVDPETLDSRDWRHRAPRIGATPNQPALLAVETAIRHATDLPQPLPLVVVAGGDIDLVGADWAAFSAVQVVQVTPELEEDLERSMDLPSEGVRFLPFAADSAAAVAAAVAGLAASPDATRGALQADFRRVAELADSEGLPPILPYARSHSGPLAEPPAFVDAATEWFALPLWVVIQQDRLRLTDPP